MGIIDGRVLRLGAPQDDAYWCGRRSRWSPGSLAMTGSGVCVNARGSFVASLLRMTPIGVAGDRDGRRAPSR